MTEDEYSEDDYSEDDAHEDEGVDGEDDGTVRKRRIVRTVFPSMGVIDVKRRRRRGESNKRVIIKP
jgi:hypothetical protein